MELTLFRSLWTTGFNLDRAISDCTGGLFDGVEGPVPADPATARAFTARLQAARLPFIAEVVTGGDYVPRYTGLTQHLADFRELVQRALDAEPLFINALAGSDSWSAAESLEFFGAALAVSGELGVEIAFETHRSRSTFSPWATRELLEQLPELTLTCDFSHWCCVTERLVLEEESALLQLCAERARHLHARVGYSQGPQVPHPAAPEYSEELAAHESWWQTVWTAQRAAGRRQTTMTPEFGPDGYLHHHPFSDVPVASLDEINRWMAERERARFRLFV